MIMKTKGTKPISFNFAVDELDYLLKTRTKEELDKMFEDARPKLNSFKNIKVYYGTE